MPAGAGSYQFCTGINTCGDVVNNCTNVGAGTSISWEWTLDGACGSTDDYDMFIRISGSAAPGFECSPYTLTYSFDAGYCF